MSYRSRSERRSSSLRASAGGGQAGRGPAARGEEWVAVAMDDPVSLLGGQRGLRGRLVAVRAVTAATEVRDRPHLLEDGGAERAIGQSIGPADRDEHRVGPGRDVVGRRLRPRRRRTRRPSAVGAGEDRPPEKWGTSRWVWPSRPSRCNRRTTSSSRSSATRRQRIVSTERWPIGPTASSTAASTGCRRARETVASWPGWWTRTRPDCTSATRAVSITRSGPPARQAVSYRSRGRVFSDAVMALPFAVAEFGCGRGRTVPPGAARRK